MSILHYAHYKIISPYRISYYVPLCIIHNTHTHTHNYKYFNDFSAVYIRNFVYRKLVKKYDYVCSTDERADFKTRIFFLILICNMNSII